MTVECGKMVAGSEPSSTFSQDSGDEFIATGTPFPIGSQVTGKAGLRGILAGVSIAVIKHQVGDLAQW